MGKVSDRLWKAEANLPNGVKKHTDKVIRSGVKIAKKIQPFREDTRRRGEEWVKQHIKTWRKRK